MSIERTLIVLHPVLWAITRDQALEALPPERREGAQVVTIDLPWPTDGRPPNWADLKARQEQQFAEKVRPHLEGVVGHTTRGQEIRRNCVTVRFAPYRGLPQCHVDLAVYSFRDATLHLAVGKASTPVAERLWSPSVKSLVCGRTIGNKERALSMPVRLKHP